jgi:hypothetical protein
MLRTQNTSSGEKRRNSEVLLEWALRRTFFVLPVQKRFGIFSIYFPLFRTGRQTHPFEDELDWRLWRRKMISPLVAC